MKKFLLCVAAALAAGATVSVAADEISDWQDWDYGRFRDGFISQPYQTDATAQYLQRPMIQTSPSNPGVYRVVDPYKNHGWLDDNEYDTEKAEHYYMIVNAADSSNVRIDEFYTGVKVNGVTEIYAASDGGGTLDADGCIKFPLWGLKFKRGETAGWEVCNWNTTFRLYLPDALDQEFEVTGGGCTTENTAHFDLEIGKDVHEIRYDWHHGATVYTYNMGLAAGSTKTIDLTKNGLDLQMPEPGKYTLFAVVMDANGEKVSEKALSYFHNVPDNNNWENVGNALFDLGSDALDKEINGVAMLQQHKTKKGMYRLLNPVADQSFGDKNQDHFLLINATDPDHAFVEESAIGRDYTPYGYGEVLLSSMAARNLDNDETIEDLIAEDPTMFGTFKNGTFKLEQNCHALMYYSIGKYWSGSTFTIMLEREHTVTVAANCDAKYGTVAIDGAAGTSTTTTAASVKFIATPAEGIKFGGWQNEAGEIISVENEYTYTGMDDVTFTAIFTVNLVYETPANGNMTVKIGDADAVSGSDITAGSEITVAITANEGFNVAGLTVNDSTLEGVGPFTVIAEGNIRLQAEFAGKPYTFGYEADGNGHIEVWSGISQSEENIGAPVEPRIWNNTTLVHGSFVSLFLIPGKDTAGNPEHLSSVTVDTDGTIETLDIENDLWESEWRTSDGVMVGEIPVVGNTKVSAKFSGAAGAIETLEIGSDAAVEYFNMQGQKVEGNLLPGCYIKVSNGKATKVRI